MTAAPDTYVCVSVLLDGKGCSNYTSSAHKLGSAGLKQAQPGISA
jgi:hypothetical protein